MNNLRINKFKFDMKEFYLELENHKGEILEVNAEFGENLNEERNNILVINCFLMALDEIIDDGDSLKVTHYIN